MPNKGDTAMVRQYFALVAYSVVLVIAGCGGGGSSSSPPTTYNLDRFASNYAQAKHDYTLSASNNGDAYTVTLSQVPGSAAACGTTQAHTVTVTVHVSENGSLIDDDTYTRYYLLNPYKLVCDYDDINGYVTIYANQKALPATANIGDSGSADTSTTYYDTSLTTVFGSSTDTWNLKSSSGGNALFCADSVSKTDNGNSSENDCYTLTAGGNAAGLMVTLTINGVTLNFQ